MPNYNIAPATTGNEIGLAQMRYSLANSADYDNSNLYTSLATNVQTLVNSPTTYQASLISETWDNSTPYGFAEMAGKTWYTGTSSTGTYDILIAGATSRVVTFVTDYVANGVANYTEVKTSDTSGTLQSNRYIGDTMAVTGSATFSFAGAIIGRYRQPAGSGGWITLFSDTVGSGGGTAQGQGSFVITQTTFEIEVTD